MPTKSSEIFAGKVNVFVLIPLFQLKLTKLKKNLPNNKEKKLKNLKKLKKKKFKQKNEEIQWKKWKKKKFILNQNMNVYLVDQRKKKARKKMEQKGKVK